MNVRERQETGMAVDVALVRASDYNEETVRTAVREILELLGGLESFVHPGNRVLIKPNLLAAREPGRAVTTHPMVVRAVVEEVKRVGGIPWVGDSPGGAARGVDRVLTNTGIKQAALDSGAEIMNFEASGADVCRVNGADYYVARPALEADCIINLPKLKTHSLVLYTGAVKNMFGVIPGFRKAEYHRDHPNPDDFSRTLVDIYSLVPPTLNIMDGILAMEGKGPSSGTTRWAGLMAGSAGAVALDAVMAHVIGLGPGEVETTVEAARRGLGEADLSRIHVLPDPIDGFRIPDFDLPSNRLIKLLPKLLVDLLKPWLWIRPRVDAARCTRCGTCVESCPTGVMEFEEIGIRIDYDKCIKCLCCDELCPSDAVEQERGWLARKIG